MSRLALGTVQFGLDYGIANNNGQVRPQEIKAMLDLARVGGVSMLDTAIAYGDSERRLGELGIKDFKLITKLPGMMAASDIKSWVKEQARGALGRLGVSSVYGVLLHQPKNLCGDNGLALYRALNDLKNDGLTQKIGISIYDPSELHLLNNKFQFDIVQAPFNLLDQRLNLSGWLKKLKDMNTEIHTRSTFLQGLLLMERESIPHKFDRWKQLWDQYHLWLLSTGHSALEACLSFPLSFPEVDKVVVGADNQNQLKKILITSKSISLLNFPPIACEDESLINPSKWLKL